MRFTFDYYWRDREDILNKNFRIPSTTGFSNIAYFNSGATRNQGWEFRTDLVFFENKDWRVSGYFNVSRNKNKITELQSGVTEGIKNADEVKMENMHTSHKLAALSAPSSVIVIRAFIRIKMLLMPVMQKAM